MSDEFGSDNPFAEPHWYRTGESPYYTQSHIDFRNKIRKFVDAELAPHGAQWEEDGDVPNEVLLKAYDAGIWAAPWNPQQIGFEQKGYIPDFDAFHDLIWLDETARAACTGVSAAFTIYTMALPPVLWFGSDYLKKKIVRPVIEAKKHMALCISEPFAGSDVANLRTVAERQGDYYILNGQKKWITRGCKADYFTVACRTGEKGMGGISLLLVEKEMEGVSTRRMKLLGNESAGTGYVTFEDVKVPVANLIGKENEGFRSIMMNFNHERFVIVMQALRACRMAVDMTITYARKRQTFGKRLIDHQVIKHKIMEMGMKIETTHALSEQMAHQMKQGVPLVTIAGPMSLLKVQATRCAEFCARECAQIFGGSSFVKEGQGAPIERFFRNARAMAVYGGAEEIMIDLASRQAKL